MSDSELSLTGYHSAESIRGFRIAGRHATLLVPNLQGPGTSEIGPFTQRTIEKMRQAELLQGKTGNAAVLEEIAACIPLLRSGQGSQHNLQP